MADGADGDLFRPCPEAVVAAPTNSDCGYEDILGAIWLAEADWRLCDHIDRQVNLNKRRRRK